MKSFLSRLREEGSSLFKRRTSADRRDSEQKSSVSAEGVEPVASVRKVAIKKKTRHVSRFFLFVPDMSTVLGLLSSVQKSAFSAEAVVTYGKC